MSDTADKKDTDTAKEEDKDTGKKKLSLSGKKGTLSLKGGAASRGAGRSGVTVEVMRKRAPAAARPDADTVQDASGRTLTKEELETRKRVLQAAAAEEEKRKKKAQNAKKKADDAPEDASVETNAAETATPDSAEPQVNEEAAENTAGTPVEPPRIETEDERIRRENMERQKAFQAKHKDDVDDGGSESVRDRLKRSADKPSRKTTSDVGRRGGKLTVTQVLNEDYERDRGPSLAAQRRARAKARMAAPKEPAQKVYREVTIPEMITVQELSNRMTERAADVIKAMMKMGIMATVNQSIDADTAQLIAEDMGHTVKRVSDADVEEGLELIKDHDDEASQQPRPPVVTIMGHVDHGKTSLLDAMRQEDVVSGEAGGITQHIGAYQVTMKSGSKITFLDTPGHAAFTEMRARGANVTDIVVLVVAANDSIMPQTIEAINHAKAAGVPIIVAINKIDLPDADPYKVKTDLLSHEVVTEDMGGDVLTVEVSAKEKRNLDKLEEAILLQAEILEIKANPDRSAHGAVVEARMEQGRGNVATVLIQAGTLNIGDVFVVGTEWGKVRALISDHGDPIDQAIPGQPVEVLGLNGTPDSGDQFVVVDDEARAREISEYRQRKKRDAASLAAQGAMSFDQMIAAAREGEKKILPVVIKADVHGSVEAIAASLEKIAEDNDEVAVRVLHTGVGGITESDVTLARASNGLIVGFNVRANAQARKAAEQNGVDIRYYNIIYNIIDDAKAVLSGLLSPIIREEYIGQAEMREIFNITKVGKVAGCMVTNGIVKRGSGVRLLRDDVVIHEGKLKTLKRFKDEVKEVREGMECGMAFENYDDIKAGDVIECFEVVEESRAL